MSLIEQWPRPRVGQSVKLYNGKVATVLIVYKANSVLKLMSEAEALALSARARARFGQNWRDVYYHIDVMYPTGVVDTVDTSKVEEIIDTP